MSGRGLRVALLSVLAATQPVSAATVAAGWNHSLAVVDGAIWAWGDNAEGQLGLPDLPSASRRQQLALPVTIAAVAAGGHHSLALAADGTVWAWGDNRVGQAAGDRLGAGATVPSPSQVPGLAGIVAIAAGWEHSLALDGNGGVWAWGSRSHGELGDGQRDTNQPASRPVPVTSLTDAIAIAAGGQHSLALRRDGTVWAWGSNWDGQLGNGRLGEAHQAAPGPVVTPAGEGHLSGVAAIAAGGAHSLAVTAAGMVLSWGYDGAGQLGRGGRGSFWETPRSRLHRAVPGLAVAPTGGAALERIVAATAGFESSFLLTAGGQVLAAGWSTYGELGNGSLGGNRDRFGPVTQPLELVWPAPPAGRWRPSLAYLYTDRGHRDKGIDRLPCEDAFGDLVVSIGPDATLSAARVGRARRNANYVEATATLTSPTSAPAGQPLRVQLGALQFGMHEGDDDFAEEVVIRWREETSGATVELPLPVAEDGLWRRLLPAVGNAAEVAAGCHHAVMRATGGELLAWGHNGYGQVGDGGWDDCLSPTAVAAGSPAADPTPPRYPGVVPPPATTPTGPEGPGLNVRDHGAVGDGLHLDQAAIQAAINAAGAAGGGLVYVPPGTYLTGSLELVSGVRLQVDAGAVLLGSHNREHWPETALVWARNATGIAITGGGVLDAQGHYFGARNWRQRVIRLEHCRDITIAGITAQNAGSWSVHPIDCHNLVIRDIVVNSPRPGRNNDGIDLVGCQETLVKGCVVVADDDAIVIKSQRSDLVNRNIRIEDCVCLTYRGAFKLGTETRGVFEDILCTDMVAYGAKSIEIYSVDGTAMRGVTVERMRSHDALVALSVRLGARLRPSYFKPDEPIAVGSLAGVTVREVEVDLAERSYREVLRDAAAPGWQTAYSARTDPHDSVISGLPGHRVREVLVERVVVRRPGGPVEAAAAEAVPERPESYPAAGMFGRLPASGIFIRHAEGVVLRDVTFGFQRPDPRPLVVEHQAAGVVLERVRATGGE